MIAKGTPQRILETADRKWDSDQLREEFEVRSFLTPFVFVTRKADGVKGTMMFTHLPRFYFNFTPDGE